jgi:DNA modification methylase
MYSMKYDLVYDPFAGTGTVEKAAIASERNSIGVDIDANLVSKLLRKRFKVLLS